MHKNSVLGSIRRLGGKGGLWDFADLFLLNGLAEREERGGR